MIAAILHFFQDRVWSALPAGVTLRERRIAATAWPLILLALGGLLTWKRLRHDLPLGTAPIVLWLLAAALAVALLLAGHAVGSRVYRAVMLSFLTFGFFISHLILIVSFYLLVTPLALLLRLMGKDLIDTRGRRHPSWTPHAGPPERRRFYRLF